MRGGLASQKHTKIENAGTTAIERSLANKTTGRFKHESRITVRITNTYNRWYRWTSSSFDLSESVDNTHFMFNLHFLYQDRDSTVQAASVSTSSTIYRERISNTDFKFYLHFLYQDWNCTEQTVSFSPSSTI